MALRVLLVDDHPMLRRSVRWACENSGAPIEIVGEAGDGERALELASELAPDVIVLDLALPGVHGLEVLDILRSSGSSAKILILTAAGDHESLFAALRLEVEGYLDKTVGPEEIVEAIASVAGGEKVVTEEQELAFLNHFGDFLRRSRNVRPRSPANGQLGQIGGTPNGDELVVLEAIAAGKSTRQIASLMHVSIRTVESHITRIYRKLDVSNRVELVKLARRHGLLDSGGQRSRYQPAQGRA